MIRPSEFIEITASWTASTTARTTSGTNDGRIAIVSSFAAVSNTIRFAPETTAAVTTEAYTLVPGLGLTLLSTLGLETLSTVGLETLSSAGLETLSSAGLETAMKGTHGPRPFLVCSEFSKRQQWPNLTPVYETMGHRD